MLQVLWSREMVQEYEAGHRLVVAGTEILFCNKNTSLLRIT
jgi:hypothetical protein